MILTDQELSDAAFILAAFADTGLSSIANRGSISQKNSVAHMRQTARNLSIKIKQMRQNALMAI